MGKIGRNYTVKQDGWGRAVIEKKPFRALDTSAQIRIQKSQKVKVKRRAVMGFQK